MALFAVVLLAHVYLATRNWTTGFMPGHEFRQTQTALVSRYIDEDDNFSLRYETPVVGKPWVSILLEVPLYEWAVVGVHRATGMPLVVCARTISLLSFYLALPALYLLLGRLGLPPPRRLLVLALVLACPLYIFYSRSFLIDTMEFLFCAWFLLGFVRTMDQRDWRWLALTVVAGTGAALLKNVFFAIWLVPAAAYGAWHVWSDIRARRGPWATMRTILWGLATVAIGLGALEWWISFSDPIKAAHPSAYIFTSKNLSEGNWGLADVKARVSLKTWAILLQRWQDSIMVPWLLGLILLAGLLFFRRERGAILGLAGVFFIAQLLFPFAYAYQDYYFYSCAIFVVAAIGFILNGLLNSRLPRWCCVVLLAVPFAGLYADYWTGYRPLQIIRSAGGFSFTTLLRQATDPDAVVIIGGADWAPIIPYYSQRKALMVRNGLEYDETYLRRAFADLKGENVVGLIVVGDVRHNHSFIRLAQDTFDLAEFPTLTAEPTEIYIARSEMSRFQRFFDASPHFENIVFTPEKVEPPSQGKPFQISPGMGRTAFRMVSPSPFRASFQFGFSDMAIDGRSVIPTHPDTDLWLTPPPDAKRIDWEFGMVSDTYEKPKTHSEGVAFVVTGEERDGKTREIFRRPLDPVNERADRGLQHVSFEYHPIAGEVLRFSTRPLKGYAFCWAYWAGINVR
ncbi:MAG TPA: glycosyltransferase family 39 protein [Candidatus Didemnitutus sp.]|jgi:hypothetical protein